MDLHKLTLQIREWNANRLDLFELSEPNEEGEFFGVMRFYYQDDEKKVSTKCIRVSSTAKTMDVLDILIEKFRPDLRMLSPSQYALFEVHSTGDERQLLDVECPLLVQLNWGNDDREGRFLLKKEADKSKLGVGNTIQVNTVGLERRLSRREKKELKKQEKEAKLQSQEDNKENTAQQLYSAVPESSFTRSISNPEMVMRRRRQIKLERKLQEIRASNGGPNSGGTLKIYGDAVCPDVPYKTLLLSIYDTAYQVVRETLDKYGLENENALNYSLVQVIHPSDAEEFYGKQRQEYILDDDDCPLEILSELPPTTGPVTFRLIRRPIGSSQKMQNSVSLSPESLPYIVEINTDGTVPYDAHEFSIPPNGLEIGLEKSPQHIGSFLKLVGSDICRHQCLLSCTSGFVAVIPLDRAAAVYVNGGLIDGTTPMNNGSTLLLGRGYLFRLIDPLQRQMVPGSGKQFKDDVIPVPDFVPSVSSSIRQSGVEDNFPAVVEYPDNAEEELVRVVCSNNAVDSVEFKLMPTYIVYMAARYNINRRHQLTTFTSLVARNVNNLIQRVEGNPLLLGVWMANASELLNFFSRDVHIGPHSAFAQTVLSESVQMAFFMLVDCLQERLHDVMQVFLDPAIDVRPLKELVLDMLSSVISMLLRARVNAALTIQLFSQLFHFINMSLFNRLVSSDSTLCTRAIARILLVRLRCIEEWAEKQGLELAAECHLARIIQAAMLLNAPKTSADELADISSSSFKLNSLQLKALLENYVPAHDEPSISADLIEQAVAHNTADTLAHKEGIQIALFEDVVLNLPFLLPEDGYSCDFVRGLNEEMLAFLEPLQRAGLCRLSVNQQSRGLWTVFLTKSQSNYVREEFPVEQRPDTSSQSDIITVTFPKINNSIGLSIVAAMGLEGDQDRRIYIKSVIPDGAAAQDGRLKPGDELLEVDGQSLLGLTQEQAAELLKRSGHMLSLKVAKRAALKHGLGSVLELQTGAPTSHHEGGGGDTHRKQSNFNDSRRQEAKISQAEQNYQTESLHYNTNPQYSTGPPHDWTKQSAGPSYHQTESPIEPSEAVQRSAVPIYSKPHAYRRPESQVGRPKSSSMGIDLVTDGFNQNQQDNYRGPESSVGLSKSTSTGIDTMADGYRRDQQVSNKSATSVFSSQPNLSAARPSQTDFNNVQMFTSQDLLLRAQPGRKQATGPSTSSIGSSAPVGGHLRALTSKSQTEQADMYGHQQRVVNPWERDPKETERKRRERDQRQVRDDEIRRLESGRVQDLSAAEADHLRRLKLQAEFDRRATEAELRHEFQENHTDMTSAGRAQVMQHSQFEKHRQQQQQIDDRDRQLAQAEHLRMAEQERRLNQYKQDYDNQRNRDSWNRDRRTPEKIENQSIKYSKVVGIEHNTFANPSLAPVPPERSSSYNMYPTDVAKNVSFHQSIDDDRKRIDRHPSTISSGGPATPGVVGAQELYRDPRERIQAARVQSQPNYQTPERMSFRDKMRRFAAEVGEDTPIERPQMSRAQQRIELSS